jgi:hypothetical protein
MEKLSWNVFLPTATEVVTQLQHYMYDLAFHGNIREGISQGEAKALLEIFSNQQFISKVSRYIQVIILGNIFEHVKNIFIILIDYNLSRYGAFTNAIVASLLTLRSTSQLAEYFIFLKLIANSFTNEAFSVRLYNAVGASSELFELIMSSEEESMFMACFNIPTSKDEFEVQKAEVCDDLNISFNSESTLETSTKAIGSIRPIRSQEKTSLKSEILDTDLLAKQAKRA